MKMKKVLVLVSAFCMMCAVMPVFPVQETAVISATAEEGIYENIKYQKYSGYIEISGVVNKESLTTVIIPDKIDGVSVTSIGSLAFSECNSLTDVVIPASVTSIGNRAFFSCASLKNVTIKAMTCNIFDNPLTFVNRVEENQGSYTYYFNGTLYGYEDSTVQVYALKYKRNFELIGSASETPTESQPEPTTETPTESQPEPTTETPTESQPEPTTETPTESQPEPTTETPTESQPEPTTETPTESQPEPTTETPTESQLEPTTELSTENQSSEPTSNTVWNSINPDVNRDGDINAKDAAWILVYSAEYGAGNVKSLEEFFQKNQVN